jgi:DNA-binding IclR family transcriptional regulator
METTFSMLTAGVKSAERVLDILELLGRSSRTLGLSELAQELAIPKSSALALLRTLSARGYVARDDYDRYALTHPFGQEDGEWLGGLPRQVLAISRPVVEELVAHTRETVNLGVMAAGFMVRPLLQVPSPQEIRYEPRAVDCPAFCTAMGRILLAHAPRQELDLCLAMPLPRVTASTVTDPARIRRLVAEARRRGFAVIESEYADGGSGVAAPIFERHGRAIAALNLASLTERWRSQRQSLTRAVVQAAATITARLGGRGPEGEIRA